jgi:RNA polymerase primary sigma factor
LDDLPDLETLLRKELTPKGPLPKSLDNDALIAYYAKSKDPRALVRLVENNHGLLWTTAKSFEHYIGHDLSLEDLISAGKIGLIHALNKIDLRKYSKLSTYALHWIRQAIRREIQTCGLRIRLPVHALERISKVTAMEKAIENEGPFESHKVVELGWIEEREYAKCRGLRFRFLSSNTSVESSIGEDSGDTLESKLDNSTNAITSAFETFADPTTGAVLEDIRARIRKALEHLTVSQRNVIIMRFGLNGQEAMTLEEVGEAFGLTRERIRQIESKALKRLVRIRKQYFQIGEDL